MEYIETHITRIERASKKKADKLSIFMLIDMNGIAEFKTFILSVLSMTSNFTIEKASPQTAAAMHITFDNMLQTLSRFIKASETAAAKK